MAGTVPGVTFPKPAGRSRRLRAVAGSAWHGRLLAERRGAAGLKNVGQRPVRFAPAGPLAVRTLGAGQIMVHQWLNTGSGDTYWLQQVGQPVPAAGTMTTVNDTAPTGDRCPMEPHCRRGEGV